MESWATPHGHRYTCPTCGRDWPAASAAAWCCTDDNNDVEEFL